VNQQGAHTPESNTQSAPRASKTTRGNNKNILGEREETENLAEDTDRTRRAQGISENKEMNQEIGA
jgi:hypothetical protein